MNPDILVSKTRKAIQSQKSGKASGAEKITNELLKATLDTVLWPLTSLFNVLYSEIISEQWTRSTMVLIHKKGDIEKINNNRPTSISLMSNIYKLFSKIILNRITKCLEKEQPREQAGFKVDYSTIDQIQMVKQVMEKYNEYV